jgi:hypothetical protein
MLKAADAVCGKPARGGRESQRIPGHAAEHLARLALDIAVRVGYLSASLYQKEIWTGVRE